jgi:Bacterial membrane protein YfhO.
MVKLNFKENILPNILIIALFLLAATIYCFPVLEGKDINAGDSINGMSAVQESVNFTKETGDYSCWTGAMFSGMPNYQIGGYKYITSKILQPAYRFFHWGHRNSIFIIFFYLVAFYILMRSFKVDKWMSIAGSFAVALSTYFLIIIGAAHGGKCTSITWLTLVIVGMILIFRKQYGWGAFITMFFLTIGFTPHPQMSYYMCMFMGVLACAEIYIHIKEKRYKDLVIALLVFVGSFAVGMGTNTTNTLVNSEYVKETMRGGHSELQKNNDAKNKVNNGLDLDYATAWSYGIDESLTFLIPNYMGGSSNYNVGTKSQIYKDLISQGVPNSSAKSFCENVPTYWGKTAIYSRPVYMGAIICFLFILALLIVKGPYKWALLIATLFSVALSWGNNFMPLTKLFFEYFPMYNKFRAVSSILIVAEIAVPLLGFLGVKAIANKEVKKEKIIKSIYISAGITGGISLIVALLGGTLFSFVSPNDGQIISQIPDWLYSSIIGEREAMLKADAWRSVFFILAGAGVVWAYANEKLKSIWAAALLCFLIVTDLWVVNKRFFNDSNFATKSEKGNVFRMQPYEKQILADKDPNFRVMNLSTNTFNDARTSYYLKSVGGYSAAKLRRYQDIIDVYLSKMDMNVLNMLNTKYFITQNNQGQIVPQLNKDAFGNGWFVNKLEVVDSPNAEIEALAKVNLKTTAVVDSQKFKEAANNFVPNTDTTGYIKLTKYAPNKLEYESSSLSGGTAIFSEVYYPYGWKAYIDGNQVDIFRANYILRGINIPAGNHKIVMEFNPDSVRTGNTISLICIIIMFLTLIGSVGYYVVEKKKKK